MEMGDRLARRRQGRPRWRRQKGSNSNVAADLREMKLNRRQRELNRSWTRIEAGRKIPGEDGNEGGCI